MSLHVKHDEFFEAIPVGIWSQDFSEVKKAIDRVGKSNQCIFTYIDTHPKEVYGWLKLIRVIDLNEEILKIFEASSKEEIMQNRDKIRTEAMLNGFQMSLKTWLKGERDCVYEGVANTLKGNQVKLKFHARMLRPKDWSLIYFACLANDIRDPREVAMEAAKFELISTLKEFAV